MGRGLLFIVAVFLALVAILIFAKSRPAAAGSHPLLVIELNDGG